MTYDHFSVSIDRIIKWFKTVLLSQFLGDALKMLSLKSQDITLRVK